MDFRALRKYLLRGNVIAYPTESCYGLGCDPNNRQAVKRILRLKRRPQAKGLILIASEFRQLAPYVATLTATQQQQIAVTWPGPHTWLLPASPRCPAWLTGKHHSIAARVTAHRDAALLCREVGMALVSTSANRSGGKPARTRHECQRLFGSTIRVLPGRIGGQRKPSIIQDLASGAIVRS
jgi:L-threonylcarbamoyladenylate synthase